jgi:CRISPR-associated endonuclease/helicase Cas3
MLVTFISECEKNSLKKTRRVLDAFASRIGNNTWQTAITQEGLDAVQKLLKQTASKNTAVSCHRVKSRQLTEVLWIVGNRDKFNSEGIVAVNYTKKDILKNYYENDWKYLPLIRSITAMAALFHDWGKSSELFQAKLSKKQNLPKGDPLRHEWISLLFLNAFVKDQKDKEWLNKLIKGEFDGKTLNNKISKNTKKPMKELPIMASLIGWLIVSHHRLPTIYPKNDNDNNWREEPSKTIRKTLQRITSDWWYQNKHDEREFDKNLKRCFDYSLGTPSDSAKWLKLVSKYANKLLLELSFLEKFTDDEFRFVLHYSRLSLMLGDYHYSSLGFDDKTRITTQELKIYANTDKNPTTGKIELKQSLDEHLLGVAKQAVANSYLLQALENKNNEMPQAYDNKKLKEKSVGKFEWQDMSVKKIIKWRDKQNKLNSSNFGFFAVNMASTGTGKTTANAKIMQALSPKKDSLRFILALGLRTLTLQTGDEYRNRVGLSSGELGVLIGSNAILDLHNQNQSTNNDKNEKYGSESNQELSSGKFDFEGVIPDDFLKTLFPEKKSKKNKKFLYAPVLSCTIDYMMSATEVNKGGKYILPTLRLMSSDLVIDEIDDFDGTDLIAIGRLIHLTGMLGRKVMISSATIPPDLAKGYFNAYQSGWKIFAKVKDENTNIGCAWVDESGKNIAIKTIDSLEKYQQEHTKFIDKRIKYLAEQTIKRKVNIAPVNIKEVENIERYFYDCIWNEVLIKHSHHHIKENKTNRRVSFGVVRFANINPCIDFTRYLLNVKLDNDTEIRTMAYHSAQILIMRHEQEKHLDNVLKRGENSNILDNDIIKNHLKNTTKKNVIFILVVTPLEEVGRDHDFDWAVIEPSSYRSFVQLAGRVLRHRDLTITKPNIAIMQYNLRFLSNNKSNNGKPAFCYPGYENKNNGNEFILNSHNLENLLDTNSLANKLDATNRIQKPNNNKLANLEHKVIANLLTNYKQKGPEAMQGWLEGFWWMTGMPQRYVKFRDSSPSITKYLLPDDNFSDEWWFFEKDVNGEIGRQSSNINNGENNYDDLSDNEKARLWIDRDYKKLLQELSKDGDLRQVALIYGELNFAIYPKERISDVKYSYSHQLGLSRK